MKTTWKTGYRKKHHSNKTDKGVIFGAIVTNNTPLGGAEGWGGGGQEASTH